MKKASEGAQAIGLPGAAPWRTSAFITMFQFFFSQQEYNYVSLVKLKVKKKINANLGVKVLSKLDSADQSD